jgi:hypothetical protein
MILGFAIKFIEPFGDISIILQKLNLSLFGAAL